MNGFLFLFLCLVVAWLLHLQWKLTGHEDDTGRFFFKQQALNNEQFSAFQELEGRLIEAQRLMSVLLQATFPRPDEEE